MISRSSIVGAYPLKRLSTVVEFLDYLRRPVKESDRELGPYPYYGANGQQGTISGYLFDEPLVLLAEDGGHFDNPQRGVAYRISGKTWVNNHAHVLRPKSGIDLAYLCRVLENYDLSPFVAGTTRGKLTQASASDIEVPVPPLGEQRRIAAILDLADSLRSKRLQSLQRLDELPKALFAKMFDGKRNIAMVNLSDVCFLIRDGTHQTPKYVNGGVPFVTVKNITSGMLNLSETKFITVEAHRILTKRAKPEIGDILVSKDGTIGIPCPVVTDVEFSIFVSVALLKLNRDIIDQKFLTVQLGMPAVQNQIRDQSKGIAIRHLHLEDFRTLKILLPSIDKQRRFTECVAEMESVREQHHRHLSKLESLFASLQHRAFRGELISARADAELEMAR